MNRKTLLLLLATSPAFAAAPNQVSYQAYVQNAEGNPISGTVALQIGVWNDAVSTANNDLLYLENHTGVLVTNGLFSVSLGGGSALLGAFDADLFSEDDRWLEITVDGEAQTPRNKFLSVPYALQARQAETFSGLSGAVMHFATPECPPGWSELADARGRALVGLPTGGSLGGTVGDPLADLEYPKHRHTISIPQSTTVSVQNHAHVVPSHPTIPYTHNHRWAQWNGSVNDWKAWNSAGSVITVTDWSNGMDAAGSGIYPIAANSTATTSIYTERNTHSHSVAAVTTTSSGSHNHPVTGANITSLDPISDSALPYLQLRVCMKN